MTRHLARAILKGLALLALLALSGGAPQGWAWLGWWGS